MLFTLNALLQLFIGGFLLKEHQSSAFYLIPEDEKAAADMMAVYKAIDRLNKDSLETAQDKLTKAQQWLFRRHWVLEVIDTVRPGIPKRFPPELFQEALDRVFELNFDLKNETKNAENGEAQKQQLESEENLEVKEQPKEPKDSDENQLQEEPEMSKPIFRFKSLKEWVESRDIDEEAPTTPSPEPSSENSPQQGEVLLLEQVPHTASSESDWKEVHVETTADGHSKMTVDFFPTMLMLRANRVGKGQADVHPVEKRSTAEPDEEEEEAEQVLVEEREKERAQREEIRKYLAESLKHLSHGLTQIPLSHAIRIAYVWLAEAQYWAVKDLETFRNGDAQRHEEWAAMETLYPEDVPREVHQLEDGSRAAIAEIVEDYTRNLLAFSKFYRLKHKLEAKEVKDVPVDVIEI